MAAAAAAVPRPAVRRRCRASSSSTPIAIRRRRARAGSTRRCACTSSRRQEFAQIFNEGWRNQRDYLYVPNMHGVDWPKMKEMYGQLLPYVNHRADLNYLLDNMGAEIAIGHSYVRGGEMPEVPLSTGGTAGRRFHDRWRPLQDRPHLRQRELESRPAGAARRAGRRRVGRRLRAGDQRDGAQSARQHLSICWMARRIVRRSSR